MARRRWNLEPFSGAIYHASALACFPLVLLALAPLVKDRFCAAIFLGFGMGLARVRFLAIGVLLSGCRKSLFGTGRDLVFLGFLVCEQGARLESFAAKFGISALSPKSPTST